MQVDIGAIVAKYVELRNRKSEINRMAKEAVAAIDADMAILSDQLLAVCNNTGMESFRTDSGTVYRTLKTRYIAGDMSEFLEHVSATGRIDLLDRRVSQSGVAAFLEESQALPPGVDAMQEYTLTVRKS